jgi:hypothetical protein
MAFNVWDKVLSAAKDYHLPVCVFIFLIGVPLQWFHHLDASFVAYAGVVLGAITGHSFSPAGSPDPPTLDAPTVNAPSPDKT